MSEAVFKRAIFISLLGHITVFSIFSFSFGDRIPKADYAGLTFWGRVLLPCELITNKNFKAGEIKKVFMRRPDTAALERINREDNLISYSHLKPAVALAFKERDRINFVPKPDPQLLLVKRKKSVIMFYPSLPYHFLVYFKDRQTVHIELMFNFASAGKTNSLIVKRKISSGNLEADLLSMRYISHYLFIQQAGFPPDSWQTVKIDLSPKHDQY